MGSRFEASVGVILSWLRIDIIDFSVDPNGSDMRFWLCETLISSPKISLELRYEDRL